jgi:hypothetical protein
MQIANELMLLLSLLGATPDGFVERGFRVTLVSAEAEQLNRVQIQKDLPNATFFYATEDTPVTGSSPNGRITLLNQSDMDSTIAADFSLAGTVHTVTIPADKFLAGLKEADSSLGEGYYLANPQGQPVTTVTLERLDKDTLAPLTFFLLPRTPKAPKEGATGAPEFTYPTALKSVAVLIRSVPDGKKQLADWSAGYAHDTQTRPPENAWAVGAAAYAQHFASSILSVAVTERLRKAKEETVPLGDYALVSHILQNSGAIVLPNVRKQRAAGASDKAPLLVPKVTKQNGKITGFSIDSAVFIESVIRPQLEGVDPAAKLHCHVNKEQQSGWACIASAEFPSGFAIRFLATEKPSELPFYVVQAESDRRWRIDLTFNPTAPTVSDPRIFPITFGEGE